MTPPLLVTVTSADLPADLDWLGPSEKEVLSKLHVPHRRGDWMLGRLAAKRAVLAAGGELAGKRECEVEIMAAPDGAPEAWVDGRAARFTISLSHSAGLGVCLVADRGVMAGCDLELVEPRSPLFSADWFTSEELELVGGTPHDRRDLVITLLWSAKESVLKAVRQGLRLDPRDVNVRLDEAGADGTSWKELRAVVAGRRFRGWWRRDGRLVMTVVTDRFVLPPVLMAGLAA